MSWTVLGIFAACVGAAIAWALGVRWYYRLRTPRPRILHTVCEDGWTLAVHYRPAPTRRFREPVILCHGLAANHLTFEFDPPYSVAHVLSQAGFDCYSVDLRGYGGSRKPPRGKRWVDVDVDDHILRDAPALLQVATRQSGAPSAFWLGHSMGGLVGYGVAATPAGEKLKGILSLGSPAFFRYPKLLQTALKLGAWGGRMTGVRHSLANYYLAPLLGYVSLPLSDYVVNPRHMGPRMMRQVYANLISSVTAGTLLQFRDWVLENTFCSRDGRIDYREGLRTFQGPVLVMGGSQDKLAPPEAVEQAYALCTSPDKTLLLFGRDRGDREEYGHGDLVFGTGAPEEVYPQVLRWLEARATRLDEPPASSLPHSRPMQDEDGRSAP